MVLDSLALEIRPLFLRATGFVVWFNSSLKYGKLKMGEVGTVLLVIARVFSSSDAFIHCSSPSFDLILFFLSRGLSLWEHFRIKKFLGEGENSWNSRS